MRKRRWPAARAAWRSARRRSSLGDAAGGANTIAGRVDNVEYCGRDSLVDVVTAGGNAAARALDAARRALGDTVHVHVPVERALVYPAT